MINDFQQEFENRKLALKKDIKRTGGNCARVVLAVAVSAYGIGFAIMFGIKIIKTMSVLISDKSIYNLIFSKDAYSFLGGYFPCIIGDIIAIIIAMNTTKIKIAKDIFTRNKATKQFILLGAVSSIGVGMVSNTIYLIYSSFFKIAGLEIPEPDFAFPTQKIFLVLFVMYVCFIGPVLEEIIFRGFVLNSMRPYGNLTAIIVSSILFSMFHMNLVQFINPVLMGIILAFIAIKSESIIPSIVAHIFNNTITFLATGVSLLKMPLLGGIFLMIYALIGVSALSIFIIKYKWDFKQVIKEDTEVLKTNEKIRISFSGGWGVAYIAFYILFIVGTTVITNILK
jgi:membrane protease YdiL (CAAX protease family)